MGHVHLDTAKELVRYLRHGNAADAVEGQRKGFLFSASDGSLKLTSKGESFLRKWCPSFFAEVAK